MKRILGGLSVLFVCIALSGCLVVDVHRRDSTPPSAPAPEVVFVPAPTPDTLAFAEIDAATKLDFENSRFTALNAIAARNPLSPAAQAYLVNRGLKRLDFENSRLSLLQNLINNPSFANAGKQAILTNLDKLSFDNSKSSILTTLNQRGQLKE